MLKPIAFICLLLPALTFSFEHSHGPHLPLEMTTEEYQDLLRQHWLKFGDGMMKANDPAVQTAIDGGEKFSKWLKKVNSKRPADDQIRLSSGTSRGGGIPIDRPSKYGPKTIKERMEKILVEMPASMKEVVYGTGSVTSELPTGLSKEDFIRGGRMANYLYQTAVRWSTAIQPWLSYYKRNKQRDVRGFFHLKKMTNLDATLNDFFILTDDKKEELKNHLVGLCMNSGASLSKCESSLETSIGQNKVRIFKDKYWTSGQETWNSFYEIARPRTDVTWTKEAPEVMSAPFVDPENTRIANWLKENIEDEFKTDSWNFELNFTGNNLGTAYLQFKPNVTPHVTQGNIIVMDANSPIEEYSVKWTIRHEYGHILRLPDCYVEFYDEKEEVAVNYQLDVTDLMCSRSGDMNDRIYQELKRVYFNK